MKGLTVEQLLQVCEEQIRKGNGKKEILISADEEGNRFNPLFYAINDDVDDIKQGMEYGMVPRTFDAKKIVLLG